MNKEKKLQRIQEFQNKVNIIFADVDYKGIIDKASGMSSEDIIQTLHDSGLRGLGGAGFPTGLKWHFAAKAEGSEKYVICNADEGEPGTFKDRKILDEQAEKVMTGMVICAHAIGGTEGFIYLRGEYNFMKKKLQEKIDAMNAYLSSKGMNFKISIKSGSGAYICGEETALIESMEGKRGEPRNKPPYPVVTGYRNKPTVVNNVETLAYAAMVIKEGPTKFKGLGIKDSSGGKVFSVSGDADVKGIFELPLGMKISEFVELFGDGDTKAVQVGGSSGKCVPRKEFDNTIIGFDGVPTGGSMMLFNSKRSMYHVLKNYLEFFVEESCGQCTPCRVGCQQLLKGIEAIRAGEKPVEYLEDLKKLSRVMKDTAKCGLGQSLANPFVSIVDTFTEEICY